MDFRRLFPSAVRHMRGLLEKLDVGAAFPFPLFLSSAFAIGLKRLEKPRTESHQTVIRYPLTVYRASHRANGLKSLMMVPLSLSRLFFPPLLRLA